MTAPKRTRRPTVKAVNRDGELFVRIRTSHKWIEFERRYTEGVTDDLANLILDKLAATPASKLVGVNSP